MDVHMHSPNRFTPSPRKRHMPNLPHSPIPINYAHAQASLDSPHSNTSTPTSNLKPILSHLTISTPKFSNGSGGKQSSGDSTSSAKSGTRRSNRHFVSTPKASAAKRIRRDEVRVNPFDRFLLERLNKPVWSPGIIGPILTETPPQKSWCIDQISILNPKAIEDSPSTHQNEAILTPETEARAQEAIHMFFAKPPNMVSPDQPQDEIDSGINTTEPTNELSNKTNSSLSETKTTLSPTPVTKGVNTDLSFPSVLPPEVEAMLYEYTLSSTGSASTSTDMLNSSLTRRKLEFSFEISGTGSDFDTSEIIAGPRSGAIIHSPGAELGPGTPSHGGTFDPASCSSRIGLISPCTTPIRG